jgi:hypothetical protein
MLVSLDDFDKENEMTAHSGPGMGAAPRHLKTVLQAFSQQFSLSRHGRSAITRGPARRSVARSFTKRTVS